jgi:hypothetical protein
MYRSWSDIVLCFILPFSVLYVIYIVWIKWITEQQQQQQQQQRQGQRTSTPDIVYKLPIYSFHREKDNISQEECIVCLEEYQQDDKIRILPCKHEFHR